MSRVTRHMSQCPPQESLASPDTEEQVPFEAGVKRGKVFVPVLSAEEEAAQQKQAEIAEKVKLEADEEAALASASLKDVMALADILNTNPQNFIMEAYADDLQYYEPDPPNDTNPGVSMLLLKDHFVTFRQSFSFNLQEVLEKLTADDKELKDVNLNNISNIEEKQMCDIFDSLRKNQSLTRLSVVNCDVSKVDITYYIYIL